VKTDVLRCDFCWRMCTLSRGQKGVCGIRENRDGSLVTLGWGKVVASGLDPIEKKPLYHFHPGANTLSFALFGCNFRCQFCQNHEIAQQDGSGSPHNSAVTKPELMVRLLERTGSPIMSYTYSDPIVWQDYMLETAELVHGEGKLNCMVTNGSFSAPSLERVLPLMDAFNIDVKGDEDFYRNVCGGSLAPVLDSVAKIAAESSKVVEVTTLLIEGYHDERMLRFLAKELAAAGVKVWHLSRFFPHYHMRHLPPTSEAFLEKMLLIAQDSGIPYVYSGNSALSGWDRTVCPSCRKVLIRSHSYGGEAALDVGHHIADGKCCNCGEAIYGRF